MGFAVGVVTSRALAVGKLGGQVGIDEGVEGLVDRRQADVGKAPANRGVDLLGGRVRLGGTEEGKNRSPLPRATPAGFFQGRP